MYLVLFLQKQNSVHTEFVIGGRRGIRTHDQLLKRQLLYQLSYAPVLCTPSVRTRDGAPGGIRTPKDRSEVCSDIHFTTGAQFFAYTPY